MTVEEPNPGAAAGVLRGVVLLDLPHTLARPGRARPAAASQMAREASAEPPGASAASPTQGGAALRAASPAASPAELPAEPPDGLYADARAAGLRAESPAPGWDEGFRAGHAQGLQQGLEQGAAQGRAWQREQDEAQWRASLQEAREQAMREGYAEGQRRARSEIEEAAAQWRAQLERETTDALNEGLQRLQRLAVQLGEQTQRVAEQAEDDLVALAFEAVCRVLGPNGVEPQVLQGQVRELVARQRARPLAVHVHPDDHAWLQRAGVAPLQGVAWVADDSVALGGVLLRWPHGTLDARLEVQIEALRRMLLRVRAQRVAAATPAVEAAP